MNFKPNLTSTKFPLNGFRQILPEVRGGGEHKLTPRGFSSLMLLLPVMGVSAQLIMPMHQKGSLLLSAAQTQARDRESDPFKLRSLSPNFLQRADGLSPSLPRSMASWIPFKKKIIIEPLWRTRMPIIEGFPPS